MRWGELDGLPGWTLHQLRHSMLTHEENGTNPLSGVIWNKTGERIMAETVEYAATVPAIRLSESA